MSEYFLDLVASLESDPEIDEIGIVMSAPPPTVVVVEHKLGVSMGILKPLFLYAFSEFQPLVARVRTLPAEGAVYRQECNRGLHLSTAILIVKGDIGLALNFRKEMIVQNVTSCEKELKFLRMLFTKHPKSPGAWQHRRFCLERLMAAGTALDVAQEQELCRFMAELYPKNYYAWSHRLWLLSFMTKSQLKDEALFCRNWMYSHVSDHSGASHGVQVTNALVRLGPCSSAGKESFVARVSETLSAMETNEELIKLRPGSEALWCQRRSLFFILFRTITQFGAECLRLDSSDWSVVEDVGWTVVEAKNAASIDEHCENMKDSLNCALFRLNSFDRSGLNSIESFIALVLVKERLLCSRCCADKEAWNFSEQKKFAMRYILYIIFMVQETLLGSACIVTPEVTDSKFRKIMATVVRTLSDCVMSEDKYPRMWRYLADENRS